MSSIKLTMDTNQIFITLKQSTLSLPIDFQTDQALEIVSQLQLQIETIDEIIAELPSHSYEGLNSSFKQFGKILSEKLNRPILYMNESELTKSRFLKEKEGNSWQLHYYGYTPGKDEYAVESLLTTGNGFIGLRGTTPEMVISEDHYPATYLAGLYNEATSIVAEQEISNEDFVNAPNMQYLTLMIDGEKLTFSESQVQELERTLDLKTGLFVSRAILKTEADKKVLLTTKKIVSMANRNQYGIAYQITPLNFNGDIEILSGADGDVYNYNVARYRSLNQQHLIVDELSANENEARLVAHTNQSQISIIQESKLNSSQALKWSHQVNGKKVIQQTKLTVEAGKMIEIQKLVFVELSHSSGHEQPTSISGLADLHSFEEMHAASSEAWEKLWAQVAIKIEGDMMSEKMLNLHTYHLLVSGSPLSAGAVDASITARGLHGEAYRGHIFWDELFILPFYILHFPETAKELLMYRYHRLEAAKRAAAEAGYQGAMFPWQSGLDGREQSQEIHLNPVNGHWDEDHSRLQRHVSLAIAYNLWLYFENTKDIPFMNEYGLELLLEIAKFWISIAEYDEAAQRYSIAGVMGPDEFHEAYPESEKGGLKDNAYTNMMVVWLFEEIQQLFSKLSAETIQKTKIKTDFAEADLKKMEEITHHLHLEISPEGIIAQFEHYFDLKEIDWALYKKKYGDVYRMDRILRAEGHSADEYQVAKQADSLMIFYNFGKQRIDRILNDLGYQLPEDYLERNLSYYLARTSHGSTLSRVVHAQLAAMVDDKELSWQLYQEALYSDYQDIQGGTTAEGIHAGVMAATIYITLTTYAGLDIRQEHLQLEPCLPKNWNKMSFSVVRKGVQYQFDISATAVTVLTDQDAKVVIAGKMIDLKGQQSKNISLQELTSVV